jgi:flagellar basal body L-ring protein FlgH
VKAARVILPFLLIAAVIPAGGESLWSPDFKGYLSGSRGFAVGDTIVVQIDASSSLTFSSSSSDTKNLTLEFTGGDSGNLFSFLPQVRTGGNRSTTGKDGLSLKTQVPVVVTAVDPAGNATVQGSRAVSVEGKNESITVSGTISPNLVDQKGVVSFSRVANARLAYTTFLSAARDTLTQADLARALAPQPAAAPAAGGAAGGTAAQPAATGPATAAAAAPAVGAPAPGTLSITDAKKRQLLLQYLNRLIDIVFPQ